MFKLLAIVFFSALILVSLAGFSVIRTIRSIFSGGSGNKNQRKSTSKRSKRTTNQNPTRKKIITEDEGEYVDYEEIK